MHVVKKCNFVLCMVTMWSVSYVTTHSLVYKHHLLTLRQYLFEWIEFHDYGMKPESRPDGNITNLLISGVHKRLPFRKCLHKLSAILVFMIQERR